MRWTLIASALAALAVAGCGGSSTCGPSTCSGCCDATGACQLPADAHCGLHGASCELCPGAQRCEEVTGQCVNPGGGAGGVTGGGSSGASGSSASSTSSSGSAASSSGSSGGSTASSATSSSASSSSSSSSASSSSSTSSTASSSSSSSASSSSSSSGSSGSTGSTSSSTTGGSTTSSTTTSGSTTSSSTTSSGSTSGGEGSADLTGSDSFTVQAALEFTAVADGGPDTSNVTFIFYNAPITCADVMAAGGAVPRSVDTIMFGQVVNLFGYPLQGGDYQVPENSHLGVVVDTEQIVVRHFYPDAGYLDHTAANGNLHLNGPIDTTALTGNFSVGMDDGTSLLSSTFYAPYCMSQ